MFPVIVFGERKDQCHCEIDYNNDLELVFFPFYLALLWMLWK